MEGMILVHVFVFLVALISYIFIRRNRRDMAKLPPGSLGWPYIGETLQLYSQDPNVFFANKQKRYGEIFKTHILGCPSIMLASPEAARFVLVTQAHLFKPTYPKSKENLIGPLALFFHQGEYHTRLRKLVQGSLSLDNLRGLVSDIEAISVSTLNSWTDGHIVNTFYEMKKLSFEVGILAIFGHLGTSQKEQLKRNYSIVDKGYNSFPTKLPGTPFKKAIMARRQLQKILSELISKRKEKTSIEKDLLGCLLNSKDEKGEILSEDQIADNIIGVLFAAQDTTASAMTWILKYLHDHPKLLETVKGEQKLIHQLNDEANLQLTWTQTRNMPITHKVILESLRMASIISFTFREAVTDVEYKGFRIPKGWKVMPLFRNIHHNPEFFPNPREFDPSRFEVAPKPNTFMPFGSGVHACPGNELAKLEMLIMVHHLVTKYRWEVVGSESRIQYGPFPVPMHGLPARFLKEST
ncbi:abscisic acid 8'-hydroxylase 4 isoform X2 [Cynara cardunculus var. scolymus]|uniref:abscisic acid 8'-hydroxylase 4 isoform X2 n=1 Tax=Cynara cardunculus var. scolymus TaxID=59895 RepID=UPI000D62B924|nr:abscisic acid 8'-hydroxylase 4 isoform X2 [Cynara cardunculus var. scolymus]